MTGAVEGAAMGEEETETTGTSTSSKRDGRTFLNSGSSTSKKFKTAEDGISPTSAANAERSKAPGPSSRKSLNASPSAATTSAAAAAAAAAASQDNHPYARGAVIEVWHYSKKDDWWSDPDSSDDDDGSSRTVRLCDIIDRANVPDKGWRYYVHYRDFNRRMDEWIGIERVVSPPSIGNAKARALKRKKEKMKHQQQLQSMYASGASNSFAEGMDAAAPRGRRRTSLQQQDSSSRSESPANASLLLSPESVAAATAAAVAELSSSSAAIGTGASAAAVSLEGISSGAPSGAGGPGRRRRQSSRRKVDDDATVVASNIADEEQTSQPLQGQAGPQVQSSSQLKQKNQIVLTDHGVTTHTVGEHVVATVQAQELDEHEGLDEASLREHEEVTKVKNVNFLELGEFQMETWYFSPLPKELCGPSGFLEVLYVCEFTLNLFARKSELRRFQRRLEPSKRHPPGNEIYRCGNLSMFEVDGLEEKIYCQNLCYIAKLFLDHKTLYFDVDPFLFYVMCEVDDRGFHPVGYFSKEKYSDVGYNLACILTFPAHQRKGYGRFIISFSYELSKKEEKVGSPEKPMSDLGQQAYKPYWASTILDFLLHQSDESRLSIMDIAKKTSIMAEDIVFTLNQLGILKIINGVYLIAAEQSLLQRLAVRYPVKEPRVEPGKLHWTPFLTDIKRDKFSIHSKKPSVEAEEKKVG